ncbi:MAG: Hpt domain-containing protein [Thiolinea sp.]
MTTNYTDAIDQETYSLLQDLMGEEGFEEIIDFFCSDTKQAVNNLRQAINDQKADFVGGVCHKLKSSSKLIGAFTMADIATELELYADHKNATLASQLLDQLETEFQRAEQWIQSATALT